MTSLDPQKNSPRALFVTFEGTEGVGKSTQVRAIAEHYQRKGLKVLTTREPGGTDIGNEIRAILVQTRSEQLCALSELFLLQAARAQHVSQILRPALHNYHLILCDRYADASVAYQGFGRGLDPTWVQSLNEKACDGLTPNLTLLMDMPMEAALERALSRIEASTGAKEDRFEKEAKDFHRRVREGYLSLAKQNPSRFVVVDSNRTPQKITQNMLAVIDERLKPSS